MGDDVQDLMSLCGVLQPAINGVTLEDMEEAIRKGATGDDRQEANALLQRAERGERIVVLRDGRPVAALIPLSQLPEGTEQQRLAELESRGLVTLPRQTGRNGFQGPAVPNRGKLASEVVSEDRR